ncbi:hypothetical protein A2867_02555 [Candidatus Daviesbacteria bacterium RIFCSPHIGHO2_01_FULL_40_11]|uniref:Uncharacterized protein n=1 Tax=Candidatus Daviesbacteria bacterium RIFCSPHIGHO2_01_FULL_40_11 TaxID=1797762 RepID=A0A1F5JFP7_9BACT|nr:MAG: hypothetical protein A2867_02555 [Candidatus Daviesbacteria bacterium RIFCSPHIGHO2_01_FULL_40_11]
MPIERIEVEPRLSQQLFQEVVKGITLVLYQANLELRFNGQTEKRMMGREGFHEFRTTSLPQLLDAGYEIGGGRFRLYSNRRVEVHLVDHQRCGQVTLTVHKLDEDSFKSEGEAVISWWETLKEKFPQKPPDGSTSV